jgi:hypothetical protein
MNDNVRNHQKNWIQSLLKTKVCKVVFEKLDGSERTMICTLKEDLLPTVVESKTKKTPNEKVMPVWDIEAQSWRSFRVDSVIEFSEYEKIEG